METQPLPCSDTLPSLHNAVTQPLVDVTAIAKSAGIYADYTGITLTTWHQAIDVKECAITFNRDKQLHRLLVLARRAALAASSGQTIVFTVACPPSRGSTYLHQALKLTLNLSQTEQGTHLIIQTESECQHSVH